MTTENTTLQEGQAITANAQGQLEVPNNPIIPYIVGDGIGVDITPVMLKVVDAAVNKAYGGDRKISWLETYAGVAATEYHNDDIWLPTDTVNAFKQYKVGIKGPLDAPVGSGLQSLSIQLRNELAISQSLFAFQCFEGLPKLINHQQVVDIEIFQSEPNLLAKTDDSATVNEESYVSAITVDKSDVEQLLNTAIAHAIKQNKTSVTLVHGGSTTAKFTEGLCKWGYQFAKAQYDGKELNGSRWVAITNPHTGKDIIIKDLSVDALIQQVVSNPAEYSVLVAPFAYGTSLKSLLCALTNTVGITPACYLSNNIAIFEATHGTAQKYAGLNKVNPSSILLAAVLMLMHIGWQEAANYIIAGIRGAIGAKTVTYDLANKIADSTILTCSGFGDCIIEHM